jgi:hypothetical protein
VYNYHTQVPVLLDITLPPGTRVIGMDLCTIQPEAEVLVISQGYLAPRSERDEKVNAPWLKAEGLPEGMPMWVRRVHCDFVPTAGYPPKFKQVCV